MSIFDTVIKKKSIFNTVSDIRKQHSTYTKFREAEAAEAEFEAVKAKEDASLLGVLRKPGEVVKGIGQFLFSKEAIEKRATPQEPITFGIPGTGLEIQRPSGFGEKIVKFLGHSILKPQSQQVIDRTENFKSKGIEEDRAKELAVKSVIGETPINKIIASPEFTPEETKAITDAMTEHGVYSLFDVLAVMPGTFIGKLGKADDLAKAAKEAYEAQQIIKKAKGVPKGIAPPKKTKSIYNAVIKPKLDTTALKTVEPEIPKKPLKDVVFDLKDDIVKERFALSALREKAGYKYTPKEDKAFNFLNDALYKIDVEKFDDAKQIMRNFEKYREEKGLIPVFKQGQTAMGESASYKYIGDTGWRKGRIDNFGKFIRKTITDFETKKITPKPTKELQPLTQEAKKFKSAEELLNSIKKEPLDVGIDRKNLFEAYKIDESETYIIGKKTGKMIDEPVSIVDTAGKKISERIDKIPEVEYRIATFDKNIDDNLYNSFLRSKDIIKKENLKQQLTDIYNKAVKGVEKPTQKLLTGKVAIEGEGFFMTPSKERLTRPEARKKKFRAEAEVKAIKKETLTKAKDIYDKQVAKIKTNKELLQRRRSFIKAVQKQFGLSDADLRTITQRDIRLMSNVEFKTFLDDVRTKSEHLAVTNQARSELIDQITTKNLNIEPLRQAMKLPSLKNMDLAQIRKLDETLTPYLKDDIFLSKRKLETIEKTELSGIKTYREAREILAKKLGVKPEDLNNIKIGEFDRFKGHSALAEKDPFFRMVIEETSKVRLIREAEFLEIEKTLNNLAKKLKTSLVEKFIPQQKNIRRWFEATDKSAIHLTQEELEVVKFMQGEWIKARDYLVKIQAFNKGIKAENYFTHIRRGILEAVKEDGIVKATKEVFNQYRLDEQVFNILDRETGQIMALEKFFQFAMKRTGELKPTENIIEAFRVYMRTFKKKQALDEIVPLIDTYAHVLTPKETTKSGLLLHGDLQRFMKEWLNTQKGRRITLIAKQGGKIEWGLKAGRTLTTLLDIGLNIPVTVATQVGEQVISYQLLGKGKYLLSKIRAITPKGKRITAKYRNLIGKNPWSELIEPARKVGDRLNESIFVAFRDANVRRNRNVMLGSMTKEEWASETLSPERLANMKIEIGRYGVMDDAKSIIGATPEAGVFTQYKTWAIPILGAVTRNIKYLSKYLATLSKLESVRGKRALSEFYRLIELLAFVGITYALIRPDQKDESMIGKIKQRAFQEATTMIQAIEPKMFTSVTRLQSFVKDLGEIAHSLYTLEKYQVSKFGKYAAGELKGLKQLIKLFTPRAIKQFDKDKQKQLTDIKTEILEDIESGKLSVSAAKEKFINEIKKMEQKQKEKRFEMSLGDYKKDLTTRIENKEITTEEGKEEFVEYAKENVDSFESPDEASFVDKIKLYAKAIGIDPVTAFVFIFTDEKIRKIENGAIIVERMPLEESQKVRKERGATRELILDHTLSLQLGGSNRDSNLKLVSVEEWERYTVMENYLGNKLRAGLIEKEEAQKLIKDFKNGIISEEDIIK